MQSLNEEDQKPNPVVERVKMIMIAGLFIVHANRYIYIISSHYDNAMNDFFFFNSQCTSFKNSRNSRLCTRQCNIVYVHSAEQETAAGEAIIKSDPISFLCLRFFCRRA